MTLRDHIDSESQELKRLNRRCGKEYWPGVQGLSRCAMFEQMQHNKSTKTTKSLGANALSVNRLRAVNGSPRLPEPQAQPNVSLCLIQPLGDVHSDSLSEPESNSDVGLEFREIKEVISKRRAAKVEE